MTITRLIINADDFGMSRGITDGILVAHRYGILTSASLMANMPAAEYAVVRAQTLPCLGVGVHLNICQGQPLSPPNEIPSLLDSSGTFHSSAVLARKMWTGRIALKHIEAEFAAQIRWVKDRGIVPTHADSHHHMHLYPVAALAFVRALKAEGVPCMRSSICSVWPRTRLVAPPHEGWIARRVLVQTYRATLQRTIFRRIHAPDSRISFQSAHRKYLPQLHNQWRAALQHLPPGTFELACHPGLFESGFSESDRIQTQRAQEMIWLTEHELRDVIDDREIQLITYRGLATTEAAAMTHAETETVTL